MDAERLRAVWESEIDRLELDVIRAERLANGTSGTPADPWIAPPVIDPMPEDLVPRATALLERQEAARAALTASMTHAQQNVAYTERVAAATTGGESTPIYLDVEA